MNIPANLLVELDQVEDLPSPPDIVTRIIEFLKDPEADFDELSDLITKDPALVVKILKTANSAMYARRREVTNLKQALLTLGQATATTLALSFSLVSSLRKDDRRGIDLRHYWRRSLLSATVARALGAALWSEREEELFLAGLLQDIGLLVLDKLRPELYRELGDQMLNHKVVYESEIAELGVDHASVGSWLLERWGLPAIICESVEHSHDSEAAVHSESSRQFFGCVSLACQISDVLLIDQREESIAELARRLQERLQLDEASTLNVLDEVSEQIPAIESQFGIDILDAEIANTIVDRARQILTEVSLQARHEISGLHEEIDSLGNKVTVLEQENETDKLTGLRSRDFIDKHLAVWVARARLHDFPLSLAFLDLDGFKVINDTYSHAAGDEILKSTAKLLISQIRDNDTLARYGGDEFVLLLGGKSAANARMVCDRILKAFNETKHSVNGESVELYISIGFATLEMTKGRSEIDLIKAADAALKSAKEGGRARVVDYVDI